ncbi:hypothetical protein D3C85_1665390 [compost metagenome]
MEFTWLERVIRDCMTGLALVIHFEKPSMKGPDSLFSDHRSARYSRFFLQSQFSRCLHLLIYRNQLTA